MKKEQVLLIEDDADIREGVRILLESENYCVEEAENGKSGLELLSDETDLVILDIMMPGMSGLRTWAEIMKSVKKQNLICGDNIFCILCHQLCRRNAH